MFGSVKGGPNHYEVLGLTPSATSDDIDEAFTARMKMRTTNPEKAGDPLQLRAAYKTLHDPFWRRIYDAELGLAPEPRPEPPQTHPQEARAEERVAPFIAASLRQPPGETEHPHAPDFILMPEVEDAKSTVEESPEPPIVEAAYAGEDDAPVTEAAYADEKGAPVTEAAYADEKGAPVTEAAYADEKGAPVTEARGRRSEWNRAGAVTGFAVLGLGLVSLLIGLGVSFDRSPKTAAPAPVTAPIKQSATRPGVLAQTAPQAPEAESPSLSAETTAVPVKPEGADSVAVGSSAMVDSARAPTADDVADDQIAEQPGPATVASSADPLAPAAGSASATSADTATARPAAPSPPAAVAQAVSPAPAVRPAPVVNRAAAPRWLSGGLVKGDNPRGRYRGTVTVQFTVQPNGRVSGCRAAVSSGSSALDARTCQLVEQRLRFRPALNWQGRAIPYETRAIYTWGVKHRSLLDQLLKPNPR